MMQAWFAFIIYLGVAGLLPHFVLAEESSSQPAATSVASSASSSVEKQSSKFKLSTSYSVSSDFAEQESPRTLSHAWMFSAAYKLPSDLSVWTALDAFYESQGRQVISSEHDGPFSSNITSGITKKNNLGSLLYGDHSISASVRSTFPISEQAKYEHRYAIPGVKLSLSSGFLDSRINVENSVLYTYILQGYKYSPLSGRLNSKDSFSYSVSSVVKIVGDLSAGLGFGLNLSRKLDDSVEYKYNNSQSLAYSFGKLTVDVTYENGGFTRDGDVELWYIDKYRRVFSGSISYVF